MSLVDGQRKVSLRQRMLAYCLQHKIAVPPAFHEAALVYAIAVIDRRSPEKPKLVGETFYNTAGVWSWLKRRRQDPSDDRVLDFKRGCEWVLTPELDLIRDAPGGRVPMRLVAAPVGPPAFRPCASGSRRAPGPSTAPHVSAMLHLSIRSG